MSPPTLSHPGKKRAYSRWYDTRPPVQQSLGLIVLFPEPLQAPIAQGMIEVANNRFKAEKTLQNLKCLGKDQVMALYKTNKRQRQLDQCQHLLRLCRYLLILPPDKGDDLCEKMIRLMRLIGRYIRHCQHHDLLTDVTVAKELIKMFTFRSEQAAVTVLTELEHSAGTQLDTLQTYNALKAIFSEDRLIATDF
jgi:hypothetical protein